MTAINEDAPPPDERITKFGLLMEAAVAYQQTAEDALGKLKAHTQGIDAIVRDEIRRTMVDELLGLGEECKRAEQSLRRVQRAANVRIALWSVGITGICVILGLAALWWILPSKAKVQALRLERDQLVETVAQLERRGGSLDLRRCGDEGRLCVRIDPKAPAFGEQRDYRVVRETRVAHAAASRD